VVDTLRKDDAHVLRLVKPRCTRTLDLPMRILPSLFLTAATAILGFSQEPAPVTKPQRPIAAVEHVVIISVDGLRPDKVLQATMPTVRGLLKDGAYTFWARTTAMAITLPSHTSMLTGVAPSKHGIYWNEDLPLTKPYYPKVPTVMEMATKAGYSTAMVAGKSKFATLNRPDTIKYVWVPTGTNAKDNNDGVVEQAVKIIAAHQPELMFIHFPDCDTIGHAKGWGSADYLAQVEKTDGQLTALFQALEAAGMSKSTVVIISSDHGGQGLVHGPEDERSRNIPWIVTGPGVRRGFDLTQIAALNVRTEDTCATACWLLGLPQRVNFDGKPLREAFEPVP